MLVVCNALSLPVIF